MFRDKTAIRLIVEHVFHGRPIPATHYLNPSIVMRSNLYLFRETRHLRPLSGQFTPVGSEAALAATGVGVRQGSKG